MATAESKVISAVCNNKDISVIMGEDQEIFGAYGDVFDFMKEYYLKHRAVPARELLEEKFSYVDLIETSSPTAYYVDELRNNFVKSAMENILLGASERLEIDTAGSVLEKLTTKLAKLGKYTSSVNDVNLMDAEAAAEHFEKLRSKSLDGGSPGIPTGFKSMDAFYPTGMAPGHSIVLMGYTGKMKSLWSGLLAVNAWKQGKKVMVVSLEMTPEEYRERMYAMMSDGLFTMDDLARGDVNQDDFRTWSGKALEGSSDFVVVSNTGISEVTPNTIQAKIDTHRPDIVVLDYLQLMSDNGRSQAMTPRMLNLSREIKLMAVSNNIPIVSITAVTDEDKDKRDAPPLLSQVAWSKGIEYDANMVIAVHRHDGTNLVEIACRKNRHGEMFNFGFEVDANRGQWIERTDAF